MAYQLPEYKRGDDMEKYIALCNKQRDQQVPRELRRIFAGDRAIKRRMVCGNLLPLVRC